MRGGVARLRLRGAGCAAAVSSTTISVPSLTLSPTLTLTSLTVPAAGEGTSIVALSDSSVTSESSAFDDVARLDEDLDDRDVLEVADVGDLDLDCAHGAHRCRSR